MKLESTSDSTGHVRRGRFLGIEEAAEELGISRSGIYRALDRGDLKSVRIGARRLVSMESIDALIERAAA